MPSRHEEAETVFRAVKVLFDDVRKIRYESVESMVKYLQECMNLLFYGKGEKWSPKMDWWTNCSYYMKVVTENLNACYAEYEVKNSLDLPFEKYDGFLDLLDECRTWMQGEPEREKRGMELGPVRRVTEEEYQGRGRVAEVDAVRTGASDGVHAADIQTLLCRLSELGDVA
jgi:hypothetical protein